MSLCAPLWDKQIHSELAYSWCWADWLPPCFPSLSPFCIVLWRGENPLVAWKKRRALNPLLLIDWPCHMMAKSPRINVFVCVCVWGGGSWCLSLCIFFLYWFLPRYLLIVTGSWLLRVCLEEFLMVSSFCSHNCAWQLRIKGQCLKPFSWTSILPHPHHSSCTQREVQARNNESWAVFSWVVKLFVNQFKHHDRNKLGR